MKWVSAILDIIKSFLGLAEARANNAPLLRAEQLDKDAALLRHEILLASRSGNTALMSELQARLDDTYASRKALWSAQSAAGGKRD